MAVETWADNDDIPLYVDECVFIRLRGFVLKSKSIHRPIQEACRVVTLRLGAVALCLKQTESLVSSDVWWCCTHVRPSRLLTGSKLVVRSCFPQNILNLHRPQWVSHEGGFYAFLTCLLLLGKGVADSLPSFRQSLSSGRLMLSCKPKFSSPVAASRSYFVEIILFFIKFQSKGLFGGFFLLPLFSLIAGLFLETSNRSLLLLDEE